LSRFSFLDRGILTAAAAWKYHPYVMGMGRPICVTLRMSDLVYE